MSQECIDRGAVWLNKLFDELDKAQFAILCVTTENMEKPWLLYGSGAMSKGLNHTAVCPLLLDLKATDLQPPLSFHQATVVSDADDMRRLLESLNARIAVPLPARRLLRAFERTWPDLTKKVDEIVKSEGSLRRARFQSLFFYRVKGVPA
jgi:hypothetical protein